MPTISYSDFTNIGKSWESSDDEQLIKLYNEDQKDILQIAIIFKRTPGGILSRLIKLNIIEDRKLARGYDFGKSWKSSDDEQLIKLYNEDKKDILQIAIIFKRAPRGILSRLIKLNIIEDKKLARGYELSRNSRYKKKRKLILKLKYQKTI
jgi:hypothetical protein